MSDFNFNFYAAICCCECRSQLENGGVYLYCPHCRKKFPIREGTPIFVNLNSLSEQMKGQVKYFEKEFITSSGNYMLNAWQENFIRRFKENAGDISGKLIVDCGAGSGYMSIELAKLGANVIACDLTIKSLERIRAIAREFDICDRIFTVCCSADKLPLKIGVADYFISNAVLEHVCDESAAVNEIKRVCKKDSVAMITTPLKYRYLNPFFIALNYIHDKRIGHLRRYDEKTFLKKFKEYEFMSVYYTGHTKKVFKILANLISNFFNEKKIEEDDRKKERRKLWGSNIICFLKKTA